VITNLYDEALRPLGAKVSQFNILVENRRQIMAQALHVRHTVSPGQLAAAVVLAWFVLTLVGSLAGVFNSEPRPPILLGLAAVVPVALFALVYLESSGFRQFVSSLDLRWLTLAQTWRILGIVFVLDYSRGLLPGVFALPAGWGDFAIGITAPLLAWLWKAPYPKKTFVVWNVLGIADLVVAVTLGILASRTPVGLLAGNVSTQLMSVFPLSMIPTFFVPLFVILHLMSLIRVRKGTL
jgi:hypothetical protein